MKNNNSTVINKNGTSVDFDAAVNLMDDEIRETMANRQDWDSDQEFFSADETEHERVFGESWELSKANPVW